MNLIEHKDVNNLSRSNFFKPKSLVMKLESSHTFDCKNLYYV